MKHRVLVPFTNQKVFDGPSWRCRYHEEFATWVYEKFGAVSGGMWGTDRHPDGVKFWFKEPSHAILFKLTWGGS